MVFCMMTTLCYLHHVFVSLSITFHVEIGGYEIALLWSTSHHICRLYNKFEGHLIMNRLRGSGSFIDGRV